MHTHNPPSWRGTTILSIRLDNQVVVIGDGQVSLGPTILKGSAKKVRRLGKDGDVITGFAGATADAFALFERLEEKLEQYPSQLARACVEMAKDWRTDRYLRRLEAMLIVVDKESSFILTGTGDVLEPEDGIAAIGSGGTYALSAARALMQLKKEGELKHLSATDMGKRAMDIASSICVYTNPNYTIESIDL